MSGLITATVVAGVAGSAIAASGARGAARTQAESADAAIAEQRRSEEAAATRLEPFTQAGAAGINPLLALAGTGDPTFERRQGFEDIQQSAAAGGRLRTGGTLRDLTEFSRGLDERFRSQRFNELLQLVNLGQASAAGQANIGIRTGENISSLITGRGDVLTAGRVGEANALATGLNRRGRSAPCCRR